MFGTYLLIYLIGICTLMFIGLISGVKNWTVYFFFVFLWPLVLPFLVLYLILGGILASISSASKRR